MEGVAQYLILFEIAESPEPLRQVRGDPRAPWSRRSTAPRRLVWDLTNEKKIQASIVRISELENEADAALHHA